ncbi:MAG: hypothetical protein ACP5N3_04525 [Candidatus Nanoarchaeia archaeon]
MNAIQEIKDEQIRKVAQTLRASGLAGSESEAVRMAMMMSKTSQRVTQNFEQKRESSTMGAHSHSTTPTLNIMSSKGSNTISFNSEPTESHVNVASSVQDEPRKYEEKEEFILGDVQELAPAQKKDPYKLENEFEEIVSQDLVETKPKAAAPQKPMMFASSKPIQAAPVEKPAAKAWQPPRPVQVATQSKPVFAQAPVQGSIHHEESKQVSAPASAPSNAPVSAAQSSQNAFSILLGSAQQHPKYAEEVKAHSEPAPAKPVEHVAAQQTIARPVQAPIAAPSAAVSPQKKMMMEANVDISKMFNFNK